MKNKGKLRRELRKRGSLSRKAQISSYSLRDASNELVARKVLSGEASLYRFFSKEEYADNMCRGNLLISTLEACRGYEDPRRGDKGEGELIYHMSGQGSSEDQDFVEMAGRAGIGIGAGCFNVSIENARNISRMPDGLVICTTVRFSPEHMTNSYGKYCVEIHNVQLFAETVDHELKKLYGQGLQGTMGLIEYADREYSGLGPPPGLLGFVKPKDQYADDKEYRFLWSCYNKKLFKPIEIYAPRLSEACRRIL